MRAKRTLLMIIVLFCMQRAARADDGTEFMTHLEEMRSELSSESQVEFYKLWQDVALYKKQRDFVGLKRTFERILQLIPKSTLTWRHAAWSLAFFWYEQGASAEKNYHVTRQAILLLMKGVEANPGDLFLQSELSWFIGQRIGFHEHRDRMRALFRDDRELHRMLAAYIEIDLAKGIDGAPDNWLVASLLSEKAIKAYTDKGLSIGDKSPLVFCCGVAIALSKYAESLANDGHFGTELIAAWQRASQAWEDVADRPFESKRDNFSIRLRDITHLAERVENGERIDKSTKRKYQLVKVWRSIVNIDEWQQRCIVEQSKSLIRARKSFREAITQYQSDRDKGNGPQSEITRELFDTSFQSWAEVFSKNRSLLDNGLLREGVLSDIETYQSIVLEGRSLPTDFPLWGAIRHWENLAEIPKE